MKKFNHNNTIDLRKIRNNYTSGSYSVAFGYNNSVSGNYGASSKSYPIINHVSEISEIDRNIYFVYKDDLYYKDLNNILILLNSYRDINI